MTRSSAAQEPSMDEILASIRRIIESGDEGMEGASSPRPRPDRAAQVERVDAQGDGTQNVVARLSPETRPAAASLLAEETPFTPGDEADLAARLRREIEAEGLSDHAFPIFGGTQDTPSSEPGPDAAGVTAPDHAGPAQGEDDADAVFAGARPQGTDRTEGARESGEAPFVAANSDSRRMQDFREAVLDDLGEGPGGNGPPLVSGRTGELVGASFDELAHAIREGELRSLEDMAQELLRPMLQEWLDDNLPKLVERLVREEIERVARGGRR